MAGYKHKIATNQPLNIVIDVDETVVNSALHWFNYLRELHGEHFNVDQYLKDKEDGNFIHYDLGKHISKDSPVKQDHFDFWRDKDLYQGIPTYLDMFRVEHVLKELYHAGHNIIFASFCAEGQHTGSKSQYLRNRFSFIDPLDFNFFESKNKWLLKDVADIFIDDRNEFCNMFDTEKTLVLRIDSPYTQDVELQNNVVDVSDWYQIEDVINNLLEGE